MSSINWVNKCWVTTVYLVNEKAEVLLTWNKNLEEWIPVGGHVDPGETPVEAIRREVEEETGFEFEFLGEGTYENNSEVEVLPVQRIQIEKVPHHNYHMNIVFFGKVLRYDKDKKETDEEEKLKWFSKDYLEENSSEFLESVRKMSLGAIERFKSV